MQLILIRHAQPDWAPAGVATNDPELTKLGMEQAQRLAIRAESWDDVTELLVSPLRRAQQTAEPLAEALGLAPHTYQWLHEFNNPADWEGAPVDHVIEALATMFAKPESEWWDGVPGGENLKVFTDRVTTGLEEALAERGVSRRNESRLRMWDVQNPEQTVVIVGHGGTNSVLIAHLAGIEPVPWEWERFSANHASVTLLRSTGLAGGHLFSLRRFSDVGHLPEKLVTV